MWYNNKYLNSSDHINRKDINTMDWKAFLSLWRSDYDVKTFLNSLGSLLITTVFALYNGFLGLANSSVWHGSICVYYILLVLVRGTVIFSESRIRRARLTDESASGRRSRAYIAAAVCMLAINLAMIGPIILMVKQEKPVNMTMIPAIAMATYTFYKLTMAAINLRTRKKSVNCLVRLLRSINFIDALLSVAALQNTLIMVGTKGDKLTLVPLTAVTSAAIWVIVVAISAIDLIYGIKKH